ncbi:hypothetical protein [Luteitalea sp.]|uniref:hypothetical protein n=1 Tax=Luteitalea sp. TaxID=2004800 RepID=UPI0025BA4FA7|nr:hypothetical protein [Luteitalea sp.]
MDTAVVACKYAPNAVAATWGKHSACGPLDFEQREVLDAGGMLVRVSEIVLRVPTAHLPAIARGATIKMTKDGSTTSYKVTEVEREDDGDIKRLTLVPA